MASFQPHIHPAFPVSHPASQPWSGGLLHRLGHLGFLFLLSLFVAVPAGLAGAFFRLSVLWANQLREAFPGLIYFLPAGGVLIALLYRFARISHRGELDVIVNAVSSREPNVSPWLAPLIYTASVISHLFGASVGCEGASLILGGGLGAQFARWFRLEGRDFGMIVFCAMASAFAPLLGTPLTATVFVLERTRTHRLRLFVPCLAASLVAYGVTTWLGLDPFRFELEGIPAFSIEMTGRVVLLVGFCFAAGTFFRRMMNDVSTLCDRFLPNRFLAMGLGGAGILALVQLCGTTDYCGAGLNGILAAFNGSAGSWAFFWKIFFTSLALGIGFKGGQIVPAFFVGTTLGCALAPMLGLDAAFAAALGLTVLFATVVSCPVTALILALEVFEGAGLGLAWFLLVVLAVAVPMMIRRERK
ncbi:MAG: chloride channel protein [Thermoguttaceae bacterium]